MGAMLLIQLELTRSDFDYGPLMAVIKQYDWRPHLPVSYLIHAGMTPQALYEQLRKLLHEKDNVFVVQFTSPNRQGWVPQATWDWIQGHQH